jgi:glutamate formiminotransferase / 5-formyltetrahydrofolate cyclo-ligase
MLAECVVNISEGRRGAVIDEAAAAAADTVLDMHTDTVHNRSVLTLGGPLPLVEEAARGVVRVAVARIDLGRHEGVHPRFGAADVVPFVDPGAGWADPPPAIVAARDRFARWAGTELGLPCFLYGPERSLPEVRRTAFVSLPADAGPEEPHPTAGACAVGARPVLVAYNLWLASRELPADRAGPGAVAVARTLAATLRSRDLRALGLALPGGAQVSVNVIGPSALPLADLYDTVAAGAAAAGCALERAELVGLAPERILHAAPRDRWVELDLGEDRTIESRMAAKGHQLTADRR